MKFIFNIFFLIFFIPTIVFAQQKVSATVDWAHQVDLTIPVNGTVKKINVNPGQRVKKGDKLVVLDLRILQAKVEEANANVIGLQAIYEEAQRELARAQELYDRTVLSDHDLQVAKNAEINAQSKLVSAKSQQVSAKVHLELATLKAPFDGLILKRKVEIGQSIKNQFDYNTLITLASSQYYTARATLSNQQNNLVKLGMKVNFNLKNKQYQAKITAIEYGVANSSTDITVEFSSNDSGIHAGLIGEIIF